MEPLKNVFNEHFFQQLTEAFRKVDDKFDQSDFLKTVYNASWETLELKQRMRRISTAFHKTIKGDYPRQIQKISQAVTHLQANPAVKHSFPFICLPDFIECYGPAYPKESLDAMEHITSFISCEFAIRPFLIQDQKGVMKRMVKWSLHPNHHVRRFSSEGCRPRLPWGKALPELKKDPSMILPILDNLKDDPSLFVRKSVANNINDISKDNPDIVLKLMKQWRGKSERTDWIIKHGARTLLRAADPGAYKVFGLSVTHECAIKNFAIDQKVVPWGGSTTVSFSLTNKSTAKQLFRVELGVDYVKANGTRTRKLFKITERMFEAGKKSDFKRVINFSDLTTRKHYPGKHIIAIVVNGKQLATRQILLKA